MLEEALLPVVLAAGTGAEAAFGAEDAELLSGVVDFAAELPGVEAEVVGVPGI